jgi:hypothetical protein
MKMLIQNRNATILNVQKMCKGVRIILILLLTSSGVYLEKANMWVSAFIFSWPALNSFVFLLTAVTVRQVANHSEK